MIAGETENIVENEYYDTYNTPNELDVFDAYDPPEDEVYFWKRKPKTPLSDSQLAAQNERRKNRQNSFQASGGFTGLSSGISGIIGALHNPSGAVESATVQPPYAPAVPIAPPPVSNAPWPFRPDRAEVAVNSLQAPTPTQPSKEAMPTTLIVGAVVAVIGLIAVVTIKNK